MMILIFSLSLYPHVVHRMILLLKLMKTVLQRKPLGCRVLTPSAAVSGRHAAHETAGYKEGEDYLVTQEFDYGMAYPLLPLHLYIMLTKSLKAGFALVDANYKSVPSSACALALRGSWPCCCFFQERIFTSRPELSAQVPYLFFLEVNELD